MTKQDKVKRLGKMNYYEFFGVLALIFYVFAGGCFFACCLMCNDLCLSKYRYERVFKSLSEEQK